MLRQPLLEVSRFVGVGALNTVLTFLLYQALLFLVPYAIAYTVSFAAGIGFAAFANAHVVFGTRVTLRTALRFVAFYLFSYLLGLLVVVVLAERFGVPAAIAPIVAMGVLLPLNFFGSRLALLGSRRQ